MNPFCIRRRQQADGRDIRGPASLRMAKAAFLSVSLLLTLGTPVSRGANVALSTSDVVGTSSFNSAGNWNNSAAPSATNNYSTINFTLRSPADTASYTFGGGS